MSGKKNTTSIATSSGFGVKSLMNARSKRNLGKYRSNFEREIAKELRRKKVKFKYEPKKIYYQYPIVRGICNECGGTQVGRRTSYTPDFFLPKSEIWIEAKGKWDSSGRTKILSVL